MNRIIIRIVLLAVVFFLILLIAFRSRSPFGKGNTSFASKPREAITAIEFTGDGGKISLTREGDRWLINGNIEARKSGIIFIERVLKEMQIKSPVSPELFEREIVQKGILPVRVKVRERRHLIKTFLVYKTGSNIYGNIMKIKERGKPFIVYVPGFDGDIGSGFTLNELFWQPYTVFNLLPSEISSVGFENLSDTASSFSIVKEDNNYILTGPAGWDSTLVKRYLSYYTWIPFENWALEIGDKERDKIESQLPLYRITVINSEGIRTVLTLWGKMNVENNTKDTDRLWGKTQNRDELFILRYFDIDPLIKKRSYFFPE